MTIKTHKAVKGTVADSEAYRSLCGRSSGRVMLVETLATRQNLGSDQEVTCKFCRQMMSRRAA